ncbi:MAG: LuxR C-terminal-related transcriptional regulator [Acidobacteriaceae bacterium]
MLRSPWLGSQFALRMHNLQICIAYAMRFQCDVGHQRDDRKTMQKYSLIESDRLQEQVPSIVQQAKLAVPSAAYRPVERMNIGDLTRRAAGAKLVLFRAPAGFGKTTAMRQYLVHLGTTGRRVAWLTLDALDDDFRRFLTHLIAAFNLVLQPTSDIQQGQESVFPGIDQLALKLVDSVAACRYPFTIFIDEFESVSNRSVDDLLRLLIARLPAGGQLAIGSRAMPNLQLGRLRAQGQLVEVDHTWLRFSREEAEFFLRTQRRLKLSEAGISKLYGDTEGWPAALWLASMALENSANPDAFIATFSGSYSAVAEYLLDAVFSSQPEAVQSFLLKTSILAELNKSLCDAVCNIANSDEILDGLQHSNVCVATVDSGERSIYRYHGLFRGFLRDRLERLFPQQISQLHLIAAKSFEANGRLIPAIEHALSSGVTNYALSMISSRIDRLLFEGRFSLLARWLDALPTDSLRSNPHLRLAHIWALTFTRCGAEALRRLEALDNDKAAFREAGGLANEIRALRPYILAILDRHEEGFWLAEDALHSVVDRGSFSYAILTTTIATWRVAANRSSDAIELLAHSTSTGEGPQVTFPVVYTMCLQGLVSLGQGRVREAIAYLRVALTEAEVAFGSHSVGRSIAAVYLAEALYDVDELAEAEQLLALYLPIVKEYVLPDQLIISHVIYARIAYDHGDLDHAYHCLSELEYFGRQGDLPRMIAAAELERARMALLRGDLTEARRLGARAENPAAWLSLRGLIMPANDLETPELARARLFIHGHKREGMIDVIRSEIRSAQAHSRNRRALKFKILLAKALHLSRQLRLAMRTIEECVETARHDGLISTFLEEGEPIIGLLRELRVAKQAEGQGDDMTSFIDRILARAGSSVQLDGRGDDVLDGSVTLSARELKILEAVVVGLSNNAIAEKFFVTESTVRSHLRKINAKLGANNRTQAVNMARRLGWIK